MINTVRSVLHHEQPMKTRVSNISSESFSGDRDVTRLVHASSEPCRSCIGCQNVLLIICCPTNQGQDEVPRGAVVTEYGDSVLIPSAIVNHTNDEIRKLGGEKVNACLDQPAA